MNYLGLCCGGDDGRLAVLEMRSTMTGLVENTYWNREGLKALIADERNQGFLFDLALALEDFDNYYPGLRLPMIQTHGPRYLVQGQLDLH